MKHPLVLVLPILPLLGSLSPAKPKRFNLQFAQHGITVYASSTNDPLTGQHHDGSWWVVGPITIDDISPAPTTTGLASTQGTRLNGAQLDPDCITAQGYQNHLPSVSAGIGYDEADNFGYAVKAVGPQTITPPNNSYCSLVCTISHSSVMPGNECIANAMVLTVYDDGFTPPSATALRPWYCGPAKQSEHFEFGDINQSLLPSESLDVDEEDIDAITAGVDSFWGPDHANGFAREIHAGLQMPAYYEDHCASTSMAMALCATTYRTDAALRGVVQFGIDSYGIFSNGNSWRGNVMHSTGRHGPMLFASQLLGKTAWRTAISNSFCAEHEQCFRVWKTDYTALAGNPSGYFKFGETVSNGLGWTATFAGWAGGENRFYFTAASGTLSSGNTITGATSGQTATAAGSVVTSLGYNYGIGGYTQAEAGVAEWATSHYGSFSNGDEKPNCSHDPQSNTYESVHWTTAFGGQVYRRGNSLDSHLGMATVLREMGLNAHWGGAYPASTYFDAVKRYYLTEQAQSGTFGGILETWTYTADTLPSQIEQDIYWALPY